MSVAAWHGRETVDICFKPGLAYSLMFSCLLVGIKIVLLFEPAQTHSECLMGWEILGYISILFLDFCFVGINVLFSCYFPQIIMVLLWFKHDRCISIKWAVHFL